MKKFLVTFSQNFEVKVELDEKVYNESFLKQFSKYFHNVDSLEELVKDIAQYTAVNDDQHMEGVGHIDLYNKGLHLLSGEETEDKCKIIVYVISSDITYGECEEITENEKKIIKSEESCFNCEFQTLHPTVTPCKQCILNIYPIEIEKVENMWRPKGK